MIIKHGRHICLGNSRGAQRFVGFISWFYCPRADWLSRRTPTTWTNAFTCLHLGEVEKTESRKGGRRERIPGQTW